MGAAASFAAEKQDGPAAAQFSDVAGTPYEKAVVYLTEKGVIDGFEDGTFRPQQYITRAEFATIAALFFHAPEVEGDAFTDISDSWARDYINRAAKLGLISGYKDGTFRPQNKTAWYYASVQEATNGHEYERVDNTSPETWTELRPPRDWDALEAELSQKYPDR